MNLRKNIDYVNLTGIVIALSAYTFGPWLGSRSAIWILNDLRHYFATVPATADIGRQQAIFGLLLLLLLLLALLPLGLSRALRTQQKKWWLVELGGAVTAVFLLGVLYFGYEAQTSGVLLTFFGCLMAAGATGFAIKINGKPLSQPAVSQPALPETAVSPAEVPPDAMQTFQDEMVRSYRFCQQENLPFSLAIVAIAYHDSYATVFGSAAAQEMTDALARYLQDTNSGVYTASFSVGAVMVAFTDLEPVRVAWCINEAQNSLRSHGFAGEMLLPDGQIRLVSAIANAPDDGDSLSQLQERVITDYSEMMAQLVRTG